MRECILTVKLNPTEHHPPWGCPVVTTIYHYTGEL